jgi:hypothetical protein
MRKRVFSAQLGGDQVPGDHVAAVQAFYQRPQHHGLAGADFTRDDDETLVARNAVLQVGLGTPVLLAGEVEIGVGVELEGLAGQAIEGFVHGQDLPSAAWAWRMPKPGQIRCADEQINMLRTAGSARP